MDVEVKQTITLTMDIEEAKQVATFLDDINVGQSLNGAVEALHMNLQDILYKAGA